MEFARREVTDTMTLIADSGGETWRSDFLVLTIPSLPRDPEDENVPEACFGIRVSNGEVTITRYYGGTYPECGSTVVIPATIGGYPTTRIENFAFENK